ncbi:thioredoxin [bacterium]|nr:thioredoxin [bacterium]
MEKVKPTNLTDLNMEQTIKDSSIPVLVDCWAPWCVPCQRVAPIIDALAEEYKGRVLISKLNTEQNRKMSAKYQIRSIPSLLFFKDGKLIHIMVGAASKRDLQREIDAILLK